ncbi:MAG TPA: hypothetical protein VKP58_01635 [Candidatus Acidoferrum sp.]|nr:hypothetical protein [Candidatus Acidoferrum sp.]
MTAEDGDLFRCEEKYLATPTWSRISLGKETGRDEPFFAVAVTPVIRAGHKKDPPERSPHFLDEPMQDSLHEQYERDDGCSSERKVKRGADHPAACAAAWL